MDFKDRKNIKIYGKNELYNDNIVINSSDLVSGYNIKRLIDKSQGGACLFSSDCEINITFTTEKTIDSIFLLNTNLTALDDVTILINSTSYDLTSDDYSNFFIEFETPLNLTTAKISINASDQVSISELFFANFSFNIENYQGRAIEKINNLVSSNTIGLNTLQTNLSNTVRESLSYNLVSETYIKNLAKSAFNGYIIIKQTSTDTIYKFCICNLGSFNKVYKNNYSCNFNFTEQGKG